MKIKLFAAAVASALFFVCSAAPSAESPVAAATLEVTYVANEGFLISSAGRKLLIDALFRKGVEGYATPSPGVRENLERARSPFDGVDLILATHYHADHFDAESVAAHLERNPQALFFSTNQAVDKLKATGKFAAFKDRVTALLPKEGERFKRTHRGLHAQFLNIHHGRGTPTENLGFLVELDGKKLLHIGDSAAEAEVFQKYELVKDGIDVAFLPYWYFFDDGWKKAVGEQIQPRHIVLMHIPPDVDAFDSEVKKQGGWRKVWARIKTEFPNAVFFERELEKKTFD